MDIVAIESKTFEQMKGRFEEFTRLVKNLCGENQDKEKWLGNDDVCSLLQISPRTLQSYRDNGILPYSQIGRKCNYRVSDIENLISHSQIRTKDINLDSLVGNWESINLNPTVIIYRSGDSYLLSVIHMNETSKQASPATYEIQEDEDGFFINYNQKRNEVSYETKQDILTISTLGDYMRN